MYPDGAAIDTVPVIPAKRVMSRAVAAYSPILDAPDKVVEKCSYESCDGSNTDSIGGLDCYRILRNAPVMPRKSLLGASFAGKSDRAFRLAKL